MEVVYTLYQTDIYTVWLNSICSKALNHDIVKRHKG